MHNALKIQIKHFQAIKTYLEQDVLLAGLSWVKVTIWLLKQTLYSSVKSLTFQTRRDLSA